MISKLVVGTLLFGTQFPSLIGGSSAKPIETPPKEWQKFQVGGGMTLALPSKPANIEPKTDNRQIEISTLNKISGPSIILEIEFREFKPEIQFSSSQILNDSVKSAKSNPSISEFVSNIETFDIKQGKCWHLSAAYSSNYKQLSFENFLIIVGQKTWQIRAQYRYGDNKSDRIFRQVLGSIQLK